jgi:hypothetical protein
MSGIDMETERFMDYMSRNEIIFPYTTDVFENNSHEIQVTIIHGNEFWSKTPWRV